MQILVPIFVFKFDTNSLYIEQLHFVLLFILSSDFTPEMDSFIGTPILSKNEKIL